MGTNAKSQPIVIAKARVLALSPQYYGPIACFRDVILVHDLGIAVKLSDANLLDDGGCEEIKGIAVDRFVKLIDQAVDEQRFCDVHTP